MRALRSHQAFRVQVHLLQLLVWHPARRQGVGSNDCRRSLQAGRVSVGGTCGGRRRASCGVARKMLEEVLRYHCTSAKDLHLARYLLSSSGTQVASDGIVVWYHCMLDIALQMQCSACTGASCPVIRWKGAGPHKPCLLSISSAKHHNHSPLSTTTPRARTLRGVGAILSSFPAQGVLSAFGLVWWPSWLVPCVGLCAGEHVSRCRTPWKQGTLPQPAHMTAKKSTINVARFIFTSSQCVSC